MDIPKFLKLEGESLVFNEDNKELIYMIPENFFDATSKNAVAQISGQYVACIGLFDYYIIDSNGKKTPLKPFRFPTQILCRPYKIEKAKNLDIDDFVDGDYTDDIDEDEKEVNETEEEKISKDYRLLHFKKGDQVVSQIRVPQMMDNVELFYKLFVITAKIPTTIPYDELWQLFLENMDLNGNAYGLNAQLFGIVCAGLCRDPKDISRPFRMTSMSDMHKYKPISIKLVPNYISPFTSIISENFDESLRSAIMMNDKKDLPISPLEKVVMQ